MIDVINSGISQTLYQISSVLLFPVLATVVVLLGSTLLMLGGLAREAFDRRRTRGALQNALNLVNGPRPEPSAVWTALEAAPPDCPAATRVWPGSGRRMRPRPPEC